MFLFFTSSAIPRGIRSIPLGPPMGPSRWNITVVANAPDPYVGFIGRKFGVGTRAPDTDNDFTLWRIDSKGPSKVVQVTGGSADDSLGFDVTRIGPIENE
jgi:hypothetical protein